MKIYMFRAFRLSIIRSLFTVHSALVYVTQVCRQLSSSTSSIFVYDRTMCPGVDSASKNEYQGFLLG